MKKYDQLIFEGFNPKNSNSESTQNSHIYKSTEEISGNKAEFLILCKNSKYKCSQCGSLDETMYVSENIFCSKCLPIRHKMKIPNKNLQPVARILPKEGLITKALTKENLMDLYYLRNKSLQDIAKEYKCTRQMVKFLMERYGIQRRKRSQARVLAIKEGKFEKFEYDDINENFFSEWTPQIAWVLVLIFTDGYIRQEGGISICSIDYELLEKIRHHLNSTKPIKKISQSYDKTKHIFKYEFFRERMREALQKLGLIQRKSLTMKFPKVSESYMRHFIRGCWDGDGTVYLTGGKIEAKYVSGSKDFIKRLVDELFKVGLGRVYTRFIPNGELKRLRQVYGFGKYPLRIYEDYRSKAISYSIKLNSRDNIEKLFHYFYDEVDESMYLSRKYEVFVKGLELKDVPN